MVMPKGDRLNEEREDRIMGVLKTLIRIRIRFRLVDRGGGRV